MGFMDIISSVAQLSAWQILKDVPTSMWMHLGLTLLAILVLVRVWEAMRNWHEVAPYLVLVLIGGSVVVYWTYERTEPKVLTPVVERLAEFMPGKPGGQAMDRTNGI